MNKRPQYMVFIGIGLLAIASLILLISPDMIFSPTVTVIGSNLNRASRNEVAVTTKTDLSPEGIAAFPYDIGKWHGMDYDTTATQKALGASVMLLRGYDPETFTQPLFLTIVQSKSDSSFHAPDYCFPSQGYEIQENTTETLLINNTTWAKDNSTVEMPLSKLVVTKNSREGEIIERRVVLFFYVKANQFYNDTITMVEVQGLAPIQGSYEGTLNEEKAFFSQIAPIMFQFEPTTDSEWQPLIKILGDRGIGGYLVIAVMLLIPVGLMLYPGIRRRGRSL
jgi:hypothetical protein